MKIVEKIKDLYARTPRNIKWLILAILFLIPMTIFLLKFLGIIRMMKEIAETNMIELPISPFVTFSALTTMSIIVVAVTMVYMTWDLMIKKPTELTEANQEDIDDLYADMSIEEINKKMDELDKELSMVENEEEEESEPEPEEPEPKTPVKKKRGRKPKKQVEPEEPEPFNPKNMPY